MSVSLPGIFCEDVQVSGVLAQVISELSSLPRSAASIYSMSVLPPRRRLVGKDEDASLLSPRRDSENTVDFPRRPCQVRATGVVYRIDSRLCTTSTTTTTTTTVGPPTLEEVCRTSVCGNVQVMYSVQHVGHVAAAEGAATLANTELVTLSNEFQDAIRAASLPYVVNVSDINAVAATSNRLPVTVVNHGKHGSRPHFAACALAAMVAILLASLQNSHTSVA